MTEQTVPETTGTATSGDSVTLELTLRDPASTQFEQRVVSLGHQPVILIDFDIAEERIDKVRVDATGFDLKGLAGVLATLANAYADETVLTRTDGQ